MSVAEGAVKKLDAHVWAREVREHYVEPRWCSVRLFEEERFPGQVWDPCCGFGRIPDAARTAGYFVFASDLVDRGYEALSECSDFLCCNDHQASESIVCNPPFNIIEQFALHALHLGNTQKAAMIMPTRRLNAAHWLRGTPLRRIWLLTPRPSMPPGHVIAAGGKAKGGVPEFCWLVWERGYEGHAETRWLHRDRPTPSHAQ